MKKTIIIVLFIQATVLANQFLCFPLFAEDFNMNQIGAKAKQISSLFSSKIRSMHIKSYLTNETGKQVMVKEIWSESKGKYALSIYDLEKKENSLFIADSGKVWVNKVFMPYDVMLFRLNLILAGNTSEGKIIKEESGFEDLGGKRYPKISLLLFGNPEIKAEVILDTDRFIFTNVSFFIKHTNNCVKICDTENQNVRIIEGIYFPVKIVWYMHAPDGNLNKLIETVSEISPNIIINENVFRIPQ